MGTNTPEVGEAVLFHTTDGTVIATVIAVEFWDLVDVELDTGEVIRGVRRILAMKLGESNVGRFERLVPRRR